MTNYRIVIVMFVLSFTLFTGTGWGQEADPFAAENDPFASPGVTDASLEEEMAWLRAETFVITASRVLENIKKSAASISVITERDIESMGARYLVDVFKNIPGMNAWYYNDGVYKIDSRGFFKSTGQHMLLMVNSHPLNESFLGGFSTFLTMTVENVKQIEIIRGPGSALYGANAFAGVINVITKDAQDIDGLEVIARTGSYQTQHYNALFGKRFTDIGLTLNINYYKTDGYDAYIEQDRQSLIDQLMPFSVSLAPGNAINPEEKFDVFGQVKYKGFTLEGRYIDGEKERPISIANTLTEGNTAPWVDYYVSLNYEYELSEKWSVAAKVYRNFSRIENNVQGYAPGAALPTAPLGLPEIFPEGVKAKFSQDNNRAGTELQAKYNMTETNTIVSGVTYEKMEQSNIKYAANFRYTPIQNVIVRLPAIMDFTEADSHNKAVSRTFTAGFVEDLWDITEDFRVTLGARYDHYSDFGGSFNPRAGAVWQFLEGYDLKILYGRAFRAPSFYELYSRNNPSFVGNPDLKPEIVDTYEVSIGADPTDALSARLTGFRNDVQDSVDIVNQVDPSGFSQRVFQNKSELRTQGVEVELKYDFGKGTYMGMNYTFQDGENLDTNEGFWSNPQHKGNVMANVRMTKYFNLQTNLYFEGARKRSEGDTRDEPEGFAVLDLTLIARKFIEGLEVRASIYNVLDKEYVIPTSVDSLPVDFPMPGRSFLVEASYAF